MAGANLYDAGYEAIPELWTEGCGCVGSSGFPRYRETVCQYRMSADFYLNLGGNTDVISALNVIKTFGAFLMLLFCGF